MTDQPISSPPNVLLLHQAIQQVKSVYLSDQPFVDLLMTALLARTHVLLEGVPGVAKTTLASFFATTCGCMIKRVQFTPDLLPSDIVDIVWQSQRIMPSVNKSM